jgi:hypothetical protein
LSNQQKKPAKDEKSKQVENQNADSNAQDQSKSDEPAKPSKKGDVLAFDSPFPSNEANSIIARINKQVEERQTRRDQNLVIDGLLKNKSTYDKATNKAFVVPTPAQKKVLRLTKKANKAFDVAITAQIEMEKENLAKVVKQDAKVLDNQMLNDRISSPYFLKKNKGHIKSKVVEILEDYRSEDHRAFVSLKTLSTLKGKNNSKNFESRVLELVKSGGDNLYKKFTATVKYKEEMLDFVREKITTL